MSSENQADNQSPAVTKGGALLPLHRRLARTFAVRYTFGIFGNLLAYIGLTAILFVTYFANFDDADLEIVFERLQVRVEDALAFVFPDYFISVGSLRLDNSVTHEGWINIGEIELIDPVSERSILIEEFRFTPSLKNLLLGRFKFQSAIIENADIRYKTDPPQQGDRLILPINLFDIPSAQLSGDGHFAANNLRLVLVNDEDRELLALENLGTSLTNTKTGYDFTLGARQINSDAGAFTMKLSREEGQIIVDGNARNYQVSSLQDIRFDTDIGFDFAEVPLYDFSEKSDNALKPYLYLDDGEGFFRVASPEFNAEARYAYDDAAGRLHVPEMSAQFGEQSFFGALDLILGDSLYLEGRDFEVRYPGQFQEVTIDNGTFFARLDLNKFRLDFGEISVKTDDLYIYGKGAMALQPQLATEFTLNMPGLKRSDILALWPADLADAQYDIMANQVKGGEVNDLQLTARYDGGVDFDLMASINDTKLSIVKFLPEMQVPETALFANRSVFVARAKEASFIDENDAHLLAFNDVDFTLPNLVDDPRAYEVSTQFDGDIGGLWQALASDPIAVAKRTKIAGAQLSGTVDGRLNYASRLQKGAKFNESDFELVGTVGNAELRDLFNFGAFASPEIAVVMSEDDLTLNGEVSLGEQAMNAQLYQRFAPGIRPVIDLEGTITRAGLASFDVKLPKQIGGDNAPTKGQLTFDANGTNIVGVSNVDNLSVSASPIGSMKRAGERGRIDFDVRVKDGSTYLNAVTFDAPRLSGVLSGVIPRDGRTQIEGRDLRIVDTYRGNATINGTNDFVLSDGFLDMTTLKFDGPSDPNASPVRLSVSNLRVRPIEQFDVTDANGTVTVVGKRATGQATGRINGGTRVNADIAPSRDGMVITATSNDGGGVIRDAGYYDHIRGGDLVLKIKTTGQRGVLGASAQLKQFRLENDQTVVKLVQVASIFGALDPTGIYFADSSADLIIQPSNIEIYSGYASGPAMGVSIGGSAYFKDGPVDLFGVMTPAYLLNGNLAKLPLIGQLVSANEGEGLFGVTYRVGGTTKEPDVDVNILSILTPGRLRQIWGNVPQAKSIPPEFRVE